MNGHFEEEGLKRNRAMVHSNFQLGYAMKTDENYNRPRDIMYSALTDV